MSEIEFWRVIGSARPGYDGYAHVQAERLTAQLLALAPREVVSFSLHFDDAMRQAHAETVYAAAHVVYGGWASDDSFEDFRAWIVAQGKSVYLRALDDPDGLADLLDALDALSQIGCGGLLRVAADAYRAITGEENGPVVCHYGTAIRFGPPEGDPWKDSEVRRRLLRLCAKFGFGRGLEESQTRPLPSG